MFVAPVMSLSHNCLVFYCGLIPCHWLLPRVRVGTNAATRIIEAQNMENICLRDQRREQLQLLVTYRFISCHQSLMKDHISADFCLPGLISKRQRRKGGEYYNPEWIVYDYSAWEAIGVLKQITQYPFLVTKSFVLAHYDAGRSSTKTNSQLILRG